MAYRNPAFYVAHRARELADPLPALTTYSAVPASGSDAYARLYDDRSRDLVLLGPQFWAVKWTGTLSPASEGGLVDTVIVPRGHDFGARRRVGIWSSPAGDFTDTVNVTDDRGAITSQQVPTAGPVVMRIQQPLDHAGFELRTWAAADAANAALGELWLTRRISTTSGIAHEWTDVVTANVERREMASGATFIRRAGDDQRAITFEHDDLSGADARTYEALLRTTGYGARPFWYEGPDTGEGVIVLHDTASLTGWSPSNVVLSQQIGADGAANGSVRGATSVSSGTAAMILDAAGWQATPATFAGKVIEFYLLVGDGSMLDDDDALRLRIDYNGPAGLSSRYHSIAHALRGTGADPAGQWVLVRFDLDDAISGAVEIGSGAQPPLDLIDSLRIEMNPTAILQQFSIDTVRLVDKRSDPVLVELESWNLAQTSPAPSVTGPRYRFSAVLREVIA